MRFLKENVMYTFCLLILDILYLLVIMYNHVFLIDVVFLFIVISYSVQPIYYRYIYIRTNL